jgi:CheY-like chemotaxis protein
MPEMDGFEFLDELHRGDAWRGVPVLVMTARELTAEHRKRLNGHVRGVIRKGSNHNCELIAHLGATMGPDATPAMLPSRSHEGRLLSLG